ncbi:hypothetical protein [Methylopila sp. Yamaguchi]|uniref:hypothetical protein n=1 Tax=Methylopila sp. Yamaguchi TaxID=1437817 RepID=UPI001356CB3C|nr:hypothetical protein [Methylopila sp. Yamaguchi]
MVSRIVLRFSLEMLTDVRLELRSRSVDRSVVVDRSELGRSVVVDRSVLERELSPPMRSRSGRSVVSRAPPDRSERSRSFSSRSMDFVSDVDFVSADGFVSDDVAPPERSVVPRDVGASAADGRPDGVSLEDSAADGRSPRISAPDDDPRSPPRSDPAPPVSMRLPLEPDSARPALEPDSARPAPPDSVDRGLSDCAPRSVD